MKKSQIQKGMAMARALAQRALNDTVPKKYRRKLFKTGIAVNPEFQNFMVNVGKNLPKKRSHKK